MDPKHNVINGLPCIGMTTSTEKYYKFLLFHRLRDREERQARWLDAG